MTEEQILTSWGRKGWRITARRPHVSTQAVLNPDTGRYEEREAPDGNTIWGITGPNGEYDEVVVKETASARPYMPSPGSTDPSQPATAAQYEPVQGPKENPAKSAAQSDRPNYRSTTVNGQLYESWDGHPWAKAEGVPAENEPGKQKPSDPSTWQQIKAPDGRVIALQDPATGDRVAIPAAPTEPKPDKPQIVQGQRGALYSWDGTTLKTLQAGEAAEAKPKEGDTRPNVASGYEVREVFRGGQWVTDPTFTPKPYDPNLATKPKEGATRSNVIQGQQIQQVYRGGDWVVDTSLQPQPFGPQQDTRAEMQRLQTLAQQERDRINALNIDVGEKQRRWDQWWNTNVEPFRADLQRKQDLEDVETSRGVLSTVNQGAQTGASLLNQRVSSATGLLNNLTGLAANSKITSVPAGLGGQLVSGVQNWVTGLGGGQQTYDAAAAMVHQANPSVAGTSLGAQATAAISQLLERQAQSRLNNAAGRYQPGQPAANPMALLDRSRYTFSPSQSPAPTTTVAPDGTVTVSHTPAPDPLTTNMGGPLRGSLFG